MRNILFFLVLLLFFVACGSDNKAPSEIKTERDFLYTPMFVDSNGKNSVTAAAVLGIAKAVVGVTKFISGRVMSAFDKGKPDKYMEAIADVQAKLDTISKQIENSKIKITSLMDRYKLSEQFDKINDNILEIQSVIKQFIEMMDCRNAADPNVCAELFLDFLMKIETKTGLGENLDSMNYYIADGGFSDNFYRLLTISSFDDAMKQGGSPQDAAMDAFVSLMQVYNYFSSAQMEGYLFMLNWYNAHGKRDSASLSHRPQVFSERLAKQTQLFWTEIERISIYGLNNGANAGGVRLDYNLGQVGWEKWYENRVFKVSDKKYNGNMFYYQADALAKAMNEWDQLMIVRTIFDPNAPSYDSLTRLSGKYNALKGIAPTIELEAISDNTKDIRLDDTIEEKEPVVLQLPDVSDTYESQLWRQFDSNIAFPYEWVPQDGGDEELHDIFVLDAEHMWAVGEQGTILFYNGMEWTSQDSGTTEVLIGVFALNLSNVWAVGGNGTILFCNAAANEPVWVPQESNTSRKLFGVSGCQSAASIPHVWVVGDNGTILFYNGEEWTPQESGTERSLQSVSALSIEEAWAVGSYGTILHHNGKTLGWEAQESGSTVYLSDVSVMNKDHIWAVGDREILFFDGEQWSKNYYSQNEIYSIESLGEKSVWAAGRELILFYDGKNWTNQLNDTAYKYYRLQGISGVGGNQIWVVGEDGTIDYDGVILHKVENREYNPKWKISYQYPYESRPDTYSPKAWGENFLAGRWWVGGSYS